MNGIQNKKRTILTINFLFPFTLLCLEHESRSLKVKMVSAGSITWRHRKMHFLNLRLSWFKIAAFIVLVFLNHAAFALRTGSISRGRSRVGDGRSRMTSSGVSNFFMHPSPKERRLSFLNHQISLLGGQVSPETRIVSKIYSHLVDSTTGTDEISVVEVPPNSDVVVGKEIPRGRRVVLECQAEFPVTWSYKGDGAPGMQTNTTNPSGKKGKYSAIAMIGNEEGVMDGRDTGEYICKNSQNPEESVRYYIFVPGKSYFIRRGGIVKISPNDNVLRIPCSVSHPDARVTILKSNKGYLTCVVNDTMSYNRKSGFTLNLVEDDEAHDPAGLYVCMAGINDSYQLAEYSVIRSYENSTFEYNWDENGGVIYDDVLNSDLARTVDVCTPNNPCGPNSVCEPKTNLRTGEPFTCKCQEGFKGQPPRCRSKSLCENSPCGPNSVCTEDPKRNYPKCACLPNYIGRAPNCRPECTLDTDCHPSFKCVNTTCQNPCLRACSPEAVCTVQNHIARCSCPMGTAGDPSFGGRCHRIRLPSLQFFPFSFPVRPSGLGPLPPPTRPRPHPIKVAEGPQQIFPGDSLFSPEFSEEVEEFSAEIRNPCEPWPCGQYSQCTPVGEYAHCKCNPGYVGLPPNCRPECRRDSDCSSTHSCMDNNCKNPCTSGRGRVRCGSDAQCRGRNHKAECYCPNGYKGDPLKRCTPATGSGESGESSSQENGMWGGPPRPRPPSGDSSSMESSEESQIGSQKNPTARPGSKPKPNNPQHGGRPVTGGAGGSDDGNDNSGSCSNYCGRNAVCVQRNNTITCRCKQGFTGPGSDPYSECLPSRNPCHKCGPNSICRVTGSGTPTCECQPGKLGVPPNCRDNLCKYDNDCPVDKACQGRSCVDPCNRAKCGEYATCRAINHLAVCACPHDPDKDPFEEGGCPPPPSRPKHPGFFPPTRFFL